MNTVPRGLKLGSVLLLLLLLALLGIWGAVKQHNLTAEQKERESELAKGPKVKVAKASPAPSERAVKIAGEARAYASVTLYAKVSGYLKDIRVDKGDKVKKDQILAVIESPETEQAYRAALSEGKNKKAIADRMRALLDKNLVSQQEADQVFADAEMAAARLETQAALRSYQTIRAPFDGTVTARFADPGALVQNATNAATGALPLLSVSQIERLRVFAYLDQRDVPYVKVGTDAEVSLAERPDIIVKGHVARISGQLDDKTRMLLTEIDLDNISGQIVAGSLVDVTMHLSTVPGVEVPSEALIVQGPKTVVAIVDENNEINFSEVRIVENGGEKVKLASGLQAGQVVALGLGNTLQPKAKVRPLPMETPPSASPTPTPSISQPTPSAGSSKS